MQRTATNSYRFHPDTKDPAKVQKVGFMKTPFKYRRPLTQDVDTAFAKYRGAYHIGSKSKISEARKRKEQR